MILLHLINIGISNQKKINISIGFLLIFLSSLYSQNQHIADSLEVIYQSSNYKQTEKLELLRVLSLNHSKVEKKLTYSEALIQLAKELNDEQYLYYGFYLKGNALIVEGNLELALESYIHSAEFATKANLDLEDVYTAIADVYSNIGNSENAATYYIKAIKGLRKKNDSLSLASTLLNAGDEYFNRGLLDTAMQFTKEASLIFKQKNYLLGQGYSIGNIGMIEAELGQDRAAEKNMNQAIAILETQKEYYPIAVYLTYIADIYLKKGKNNLALNYATKSLEIAKANHLKQQISEANLKLSELYEQFQQPQQSLAYYKNYITYRDSVKNLGVVQEMADLRTNFEVSQKQIEVDLLNQEKRSQQIRQIGLSIIIGLISILFFILLKSYRVVQSAKKESDNLLLNILPAETAKELKEKGSVKARKFDTITVLFTDFVGFTTYSKTVSPEQLVAKINLYFSEFDTIMQKYGLEKIKTIGDAYMCAGGLPFPSNDHATKVLLAAFDILTFVEQQNQLTSMEATPFDIRIGINTGPIVAGVVGIKKFAYDIWGDTVNVAARMESNSESGKINISENTYQHIKDTFDCTYRGELSVKNIGLMKMYFVDGIRK